MHRIFEVWKEAIPGFRGEAEPNVSVTVQVIQVGELNPANIAFVSDLPIAEVPAEYLEQARGFICRAVSSLWRGDPIVAVVFSGEGER